MRDRLTRLRIFTSVLLLQVMAAGCSNHPSATGDDGRFDPFILEPELDPSPPDSWDMDVPEETVEDAILDEVSDPGLEALTCPDAGADAVELIPISPSRPAMDCGPNCRQVSFAESAVYHGHIDVDGSYLVFSTGRTGPTPNIRRVWLVDLGTLDHYIIHEVDIESYREPAVEYPSMDGGKVDYLYACREIDGVRDRVIYQVLSFDIPSNSRTEVWGRLYERQDPCDFAYGPDQLEYESHFLAWWDGRECTAWGGQAFLYDIRTGEERLLSPDGCCASFVMMDGNWVVWEQGIPGNGIQIWIHDIAINESRPLTSGRLDKYSAYILGNRVAWAECVADVCTKYDGLSADIRMIDVVTGEVTQVTSDSFNQGGPVIGDDVIFWADCRNDPENSAECWNNQWDIYMKDFISGEETRLTDLPGGEIPVAIWENKIYFLMLDLENILSVFEITL